MAQMAQSREQASHNQARLLELSKMLPEQDEIPSLLLQIQDLATESGIDFMIDDSVEGGCDVRSGTYQTIPLSLQFAGTFFDVNDFLYRIEQLAAAPGRILSVQNLTLTPSGTAAVGVSPTLSVTMTLLGVQERACCHARCGRQHRHRTVEGGVTPMSVKQRFVGRSTAGLLLAASAVACSSSAVAAGERSDHDVDDGHDHRHRPGCFGAADHDERRGYDHDTVMADSSMFSTFKSKDPFVTKIATATATTLTGQTTTTVVSATTTTTAYSSSTTTTTAYSSSTTTTTTTHAPRRRHTRARRRPPRTVSRSCRSTSQTACPS